MSETQKDRLERCLQDVEQHPDRASAWYNLGRAYTISGRVKQAEEAYEKAVEIDPRMVEAWVNLGGVRMLHWDFEGCLEANRHAAEIQPDLVEAHFNMGQAHLYLNHPEQLLESNQRVLELDRNHAAGHYFAAVAQLALDNVGAARRHLGRAMELGHQPTHEFMRAMEKVQLREARDSRMTVVEIAGPERPQNEEDPTKEE